MLYPEAGCHHQKRSWLRTKGIQLHVCPQKGIICCKSNILQPGVISFPCKPPLPSKAPICYFLKLGVTSQKEKRVDEDHICTKFLNRQWVFYGDIWTKIWDTFGQRIRGVGYICTRSTLDVKCAVGTSYHEAKLSEWDHFKTNLYKTSVLQLAKIILNFDDSLKKIMADRITLSVWYNNAVFANSCNKTLYVWILGAF